MQHQKKKLYCPNFMKLTVKNHMLYTYTLKINGQMVNKNEPHYILESNKHIQFKQPNAGHPTVFNTIPLSIKMHCAKNLNLD
jgi:hypothetical protein